MLEGSLKDKAVSINTLFLLFQSSQLLQCLSLLTQQPHKKKKTLLLSKLAWERSLGTGGKEILLEGEDTRSEKQDYIPHCRRQKLLTSLLFK